MHHQCSSLLRNESAKQSLHNLLYEKKKYYYNKRNINKTEKSFCVRVYIFKIRFPFFPPDVSAGVGWSRLNT